MDALNTFVDKLVDQILTPLITVLVLAAFIIFVWGVIGFIRNADAPDKRKEGQQHIIWGIVGLAILFGATTLLHILQNVVGATGSTSTFGF